MCRRADRITRLSSIRPASATRETDDLPFIAYLAIDAFRLAAITSFAWFVCSEAADQVNTDLETVLHTLQSIR